VTVGRVLPIPNAERHKMLVADDHELVPHAPSPCSSPRRADAEKSTTPKLIPPIVIVAPGMSVLALAGFSAVMAGTSNLIASVAVARILAIVRYGFPFAPLHSLGAHRSAVDEDQVAV